jgi:type I restriction enzyme M protein
MSTAQIVPREKIAENGDYNLNGERYREGVAKAHTFPLVRIGDVCTINPRKDQLADHKPNTRVSFVPMADLSEHQIAFQPSEEKLLSEVSASYTYFGDNDVLLAKVTPCFENGKAGIARGLLNGIGFGSSEYYVLRSNGQVLPEWLYFCVMHPLFRDSAIAQMTGTGGLQRVPRDYVENFQIPLPPLDMQKEIVAEIEGYQKVIDGARVVLDNYRPHIPIHPEWPMVELGEVCDIKTGKLNSNAAVEGGAYPFFTCSKDVFKIDQYAFDCEAILLSGNNASGDFDVKHYHGKFNAYQRTYIITIKTEFLERMTYGILKYILNANLLDLKQKSIGGLTRYLTLPMITSIKLPLPPLTTQQTIVAEIDIEQALVAANRELISRFEKKIEATLARIWGEDKTFIADMPTNG